MYQIFWKKSYSAEQCRKPQNWSTSVLQTFKKLLVPWGIRTPACAPWRLDQATSGETEKEKLIDFV